MASNKQWAFGVLLALFMGFSGLLSSGIPGLLGGIVAAWVVAYLLVATYNHLWGGEKDVLTVEDVRGDA